MPLFLKKLNAFWPFEDCYLLGFVFAQFFYCLKLPCMKIYKCAFLQIKHPCFIQDLGPLRSSSHQLQSPGPSLQRPWQGSRKLAWVQLGPSFRDSWYKIPSTSNLFSALSSISRQLTFTVPQSYDSSHFIIEGIQQMWDFAQGRTGKLQSQAFLVQDVYLERF